MTFIESFLPSFAANVASLMVQVVGTKTAKKFEKPEIRKEIERCVWNGTVALVGKAVDASDEDLHRLTDCFFGFFPRGEHNPEGVGHTSPGHGPGYRLHI